MYSQIFFGAAQMKMDLSCVTNMKPINRVIWIMGFCDPAEIIN